MKQHGLCVVTALLVAFQLCFPQGCEGSESGCDSSPRIIGAFGAEDRAGVPFPAAAEIRAQLPGVQVVRRVLETKLAPSGEQTVVFDSNKDDSDPHPRVAFLVGGHVVKLLDATVLNPHGGGFERYLSSCEFDLTRNQRALAIALTAGYNGAASAFAIIRWQSGDYRVFFSPSVGQGRMEFGPLQLELWDMIWGKVIDPRSEDFGNYECVWCPHRYLVTQYLWRNGRYVKAGSRRTTKKYDPADVSSFPLLIRMRFGEEE
jgi:hypothetical protein